MIGTTVLVLGALLLTAVGLLWMRDRERELRDELRQELLSKLARRPAHTGQLIDELRRSGRVNVPRLQAVLNRLEDTGELRSEWQEDASGRPRRVYTPTACQAATTEELEPALQAKQK